jgi:regulator of protease activity HflC (stomatin/prohibitin superfamily)
MAGMFGFKIITQYEQGIVFRWGRALPGVRRPGLTWVNPFTDRLRKVNMQIITAAVPGQEAISRDNVTLRVDAVVYYRVVDPLKAIINVQDYTYAVSQVAQTSLRSVIGQSTMDQLLSERDHVNAHLKDVIDAPTEQPWGIRVERVEVKDVSLPESMKRSMSRQAEAERERRARIISADGEYQASRKLAQAAAVMAADPAALQLRLLQTVVEVAAEKNSTLVMPVPVELLRFFDRTAPAGTGQARPSAENAEDTGALQPVPQVPVPKVPVPEVPVLAVPAGLASGAAQNAPRKREPLPERESGSAAKPAVPAGLHGAGV